MSKKRVHEVAKEFGVDNKQVITILQQHNIPVKTPLNSVDDNAYAIVKQALSRKGEKHKKQFHNKAEHQKQRRFIKRLLKLNILKNNMVLMAINKSNINKVANHKNKNNMANNITKNLVSVMFKSMSLPIKIIMLMVTTKVSLKPSEPTNPTRQ